MMASKAFTHSLPAVGRNALDLPVAALAGLAVAFLAFAMPSDLLERLVGATGLPSLLAAAEPPLGMKARIAFGLVGAAATFAIVLMLLRLLDRGGAREREPEPAMEVQDLALRLRRRDVHPDAPAPRPISAASDFGEPEPILDEADASVWLEVADLGGSAEMEEEPAEAEAIAEPGPIPPSSLPELMERLEQGLARRIGRSAAPAPEAPAAPQDVPEPADDRLQCAIDSLQRLAARQS